MDNRDRFYINGEWQAPKGKGAIDVVNPATEELAGRVPEGTAEDADAAVRAARAAFDGWAQRTPAERLEYLTAIVGGLQARADDIANTITGEMGMPIGFSKAVQAGLPLAVSASYLELAGEFPWEEQVGNSLVVREPVGVVAAITPWNYPLHQTMAKVAPALLAGCTIVLKPSEVAPLNAFLLAEIIDAAKLPPGVFNLVTGFGPVVGEALASHPEVDMVSLTGSTRAGRRVSELASQTIKRVHLELGGKSANVLLDDANIEEVVPRGLFACYLNSGQTCTAHTRMLVPRSRYGEAVEVAAGAAAGFTVGDPMDANTRLGPVVSSTQLDRVRGYIDAGVKEGASVVTGGADSPDGLDKGYFVRPTVFSNVDNRMKIAQEEIFGPVLSMIPYDDEEDAIRIANDSMYGLAGGVWSADLERAKRVARRMRTGQVDVNGGGFNRMAPFGGYKQSGNGRELGKFGLEEFLEYKAMQLPA